VTWRRLTADPAPTQRSKLSSHSTNKRFTKPHESDRGPSSTCTVVLPRTAPMRAPKNLRPNMRFGDDGQVAARNSDGKSPHYLRALCSGISGLSSSFYLYCHFFTGNSPSVKNGRNYGEKLRGGSAPRPFLGATAGAKSTLIVATSGFGRACVAAAKQGQRGTDCQQ